MKIVIGLGNPGEEYARTRHNMGFRVIDFLAKKLSAGSFEVNGRMLRSLANCKNTTVLLIKPMTYMNLSGEVILELEEMEELVLDNLLIISDDLHLPLGSMRFRSGGSCGGHNGLASIEQVLATVDYPRLRVGIGRMPAQESAGGNEQVPDILNDKEENSLIDFVLGEFTAQEEKVLSYVVPLVTEAVTDWFAHGMDYCQNEYNRRKPAIGTGGKS